ncbi:MAG TPA: type II toxin-antitoxin system VapC family toxin [Acetobacteraceae bacterium]
MRVLLDTHILLWAITDGTRLDRETRLLLEDPGAEVLFSAASIWEIAIKASLRREDFPARPQEIADAARQTGFIELPVHSSAAARVADLPMHHRDPFDRILVAQAMAEPMRLYTADPVLTRYSELVTLIR